MAFIDPRVEIITEPDLYKRIEIAARNCYKSEDKICEGSAEKMVKSLIRRDHLSPLEHSCIAIEVPYVEGSNILAVMLGYETETALPSFIRVSNYSSTMIFSANLRAWRNFLKYVLENAASPEEITWYFFGREGFEDILPGEPLFGKYYVNPTGLDMRHNLITARFITDRAVTHELVRHRCMSFSMTSQRYVNYLEGADFVRPHWWNDIEYPDAEPSVEAVGHCANMAYRQMVEKGMKPQDARVVLPNMTQTDIIVSGTEEQWKKYVLPLRMSKAAHPDIRRVMRMFCDELGWHTEG